MAQPKRKGNAPIVRRVRVPRVWHWRKKAWIYRKDGKDFIFPIFGR
jgi:hypothetical protein